MGAGAIQTHVLLGDLRRVLSLALIAFALLVVGAGVAVSHAQTNGIVCGLWQGNQRACRLLDGRIVQANSPQEAQSCVRTLANKLGGGCQVFGSTTQGSGGSFVPEVAAAPNPTSADNPNTGSRASNSSLTRAEREEARLERQASDDSPDPKTSKPDGIKCVVGSNYGHGCGRTATIVEGAKLTNQAMQAAGSITTQLQGQAELNNLARSNQVRQSAFVESQAKVQKNAGTLQTTVGALNTVLGLLQLDESRKRKKSERAFDEAGQAVVTQELATGNVSTDNAIANQVIAKGEINQVADRTARQGLAERRINRFSNLGSAEQRSAAEQASGGGVVSLMTGLSQVTTGVSNIKAANEARKTASSLRQIEDAQRLPQWDNLPRTPTTPVSNSPVVGSGLNAQDTPQASNGGGGLNDDGFGNAIDTSNLTDPATPPFAANPFVPGAQGAAAGSGMGGGLAMGGMGGGGLSGEPPVNSEEQQAERMARKGEPERLMPGGGASMAGGARPAAPSSGGGMSDVIKKVLDSLTGAGSGDGANQKNAYARLELENAQRWVASDVAPTLLGRDANLFLRVSKTYQNHESRGELGVAGARP